MPFVWSQFHKLICPLHHTVVALRQTIEKLFTGAKVQRKAQQIAVWCKTVYEIDPWSEVTVLHLNLSLLHISIF